MTAERIEADVINVVLKKKPKKTTVTLKINVLKLRIEGDRRIRGSELQVSVKLPSFNQVGSAGKRNNLGHTLSS